MTLSRFFLFLLLLSFLSACNQKEEKGYIRMGDTALYCEQTGQGEPVILIHSFGFDRRMWRPQVAALESRYRVIRYDMRGFGRSTQGRDVPHNPVEDLRRLMDMLDLPKAHLLGLAQGANIAVRMALEYPDRVDRLILLSPNLEGFQEYSPEFMDFYGRILGMAANEELEEAKAYWRQGPLFQLVQPNPEKEALIDSMTSAYSGLHFQQQGLILRSDPPAITRLEEVQVPTLILTGQQDLNDMLRIANILATNIPGAQQEVIPAAAHLLNWDQETMCNEKILEFLGK